MLAAVDDQAVVALGEGGVDVAGVIGGHVQGLAQRRVAGLGDPAVAVDQSGLVDLGHQPGERTNPGQVGEAVEVPGAAEDRGGEDAARCPGVEATMPSGSAWS